MSELPARIGRYVVERELGRGGMGVIYKAHDPEIDRPVAIKLIRSELLGDDDDDYLIRFKREAQAAARCAHPNIVAIYDFAVENGNPYLTMEYLEGLTLGQAMESGRRFEVSEAASIMAQVLDGLSAAHAQGIVHRDIKPANVLLLDRLRVKVMDFGIARPSASELTQTGAIIGSPHYMSPEQFRGDTVDHRADLFSAGVLLFQLLTGERPFPGTSFAQIAYRVVHDNPDPGPRAAAWPGLPEVVLRALAKRVEARWPSAEAMADALRATVAADTGNLATVVNRAPVYQGVTMRAPPPATEIHTRSQPSPQNVPLPPQPTLTSAVSPELRALAEKELAHLLGPIARVLVKRAMGSTSPDAFRRALSEHIEKDTDRASFMSRTRL